MQGLLFLLFFSWLLLNEPLDFHFRYSHEVCNNRRQAFERLELNDLSQLQFQ